MNTKNAKGHEGRERNNTMNILIDCGSYKYQFDADAVTKMEYWEQDAIDATMEPERGPVITIQINGVRPIRERGQLAKKLFEALTRDSYLIKKR